MDAILVESDNTMLFVPEEFGKMYQFQIGGLSCSQKVVKGVLISIGRYGKDFDDCSYGCAWLEESDELKDSLAKDLQAYFDNNTCELFDIKINYAKLDELREGWWPVLFKTKYGTEYTEGYIHTGNCD